MMHFQWMAGLAPRNRTRGTCAHPVRGSSCGCRTTPGRNPAARPSRPLPPAPPPARRAASAGTPPSPSPAPASRSRPSPASRASRTARAGSPSAFCGRSPLRPCVATRFPAPLRRGAARSARLWCWTRRPCSNPSSPGFALRKPLLPIQRLDQVRIAAVDVDRAFVHQIRRAGTVHRADDAALRGAHDDVIRRRGAQRERLRRIRIAHPREPAAAAMEDVFRAQRLQQRGDVLRFAEAFVAARTAARRPRR